MVCVILQHLYCINSELRQQYNTILITERESATEKIITKPSCACVCVLCVCVECSGFLHTPHGLCDQVLIVFGYVAWNEANYFLIKRRKKKAIEHNEQSRYGETYDDNNNKHEIQMQ